MSSWVYGETGVRRPEVAPALLSLRSSMWERTATNAGDALTAIDELVAGVLAENEGTVADMFSAHMTGSNSSRSVVDTVLAASTQYSRAHAAAERVLDVVLTAMDAATVVADQEVREIARTPFLEPFGRYFLILRVIRSAREQLTKLETRGVEEVRAAYEQVRIPLPPDAPFNLEAIDNPDYGIVDHEVRALWEGLDEDEKKKVLEQMAREYAEANGVDPDSLTFKWNDPNDHPDDRIGGWGLARRDGTVILNFHEHIDDPIMINTMFHEVQHVVQFRAIEQYDSMSQAERDAVASGAAADPFREYGARMEEVEAWKDNWDDGYRSTGNTPPDPWNEYHGQPVEVDARHSGRQDGGMMSPEEFEGYMERAGVSP